MADPSPAQQKPVEQTAKEVKEDLNKGNVAAGSEALRQGYLDYMKQPGNDGAKFWSQLRTSGHFSDADMQTLSLGFAQRNFGAMSDGGYVTDKSIRKFEGTVSNQGNAPESQFAQQMSEYMRTALQRDDFHHWRPGWSGHWADESQLNSRIEALNTQDQARASAGDMARALDTKGADGRTLFDRMAGTVDGTTITKPALLPADITNANNNIGAYSPAEQAVIRSMIKGMHDPNSPEGVALAQLQNPDQDYKITRDALNAVEAATVPVDAPPAPPGQSPKDVANAGLKAIVGIPQESRAKIAPGGNVTHDSVDAYLKDKSNDMSFNQRQALEKLRDSLPADNKSTSLDAMAAAGGFTNADVARIAAEARGTLAGLHDNVPLASVLDKDKKLTPESIAARMTALETAAKQPGGAPLDKSSEYQALKRFQGNFNDISADGKSITPADLARYAALSGVPFAGFKGDAPPQPAPPPAQPGQLPDEVQKQALTDAQAQMAPETVKLGRGPLIDQAMQILEKRAQTTGEQVTPQAARQLLADMAKANHWPGTDEQWGAYVQDGSTKHLPKALNGAMRAGMDMLVPPARMTPDQQHEFALDKANSRVNIPDLKLTPDQITAVQQNPEVQKSFPKIATATPDQINELVATYPQILGDKLTADQKGVLDQRMAMVAAYAQALSDDMDKLRAAQPAPPEPPAPAAPTPPARHHRRRTHN